MTYEIKINKNIPVKGILLFASTSKCGPNSQVSLEVLTFLQNQSKLEWNIIITTTPIKT